MKTPTNPEDRKDMERLFAAIKPMWGLIKEVIKLNQDDGVISAEELDINDLDWVFDLDDMYNNEIDQVLGETKRLADFFGINTDSNFTMICALFITVLRKRGITNYENTIIPHSKLTELGAVEPAVETKSRIPEIPKPPFGYILVPVGQYIQFGDKFYNGKSWDKVPYDDLGLSITEKTHLIARPNV